VPKTVLQRARQLLGELAVHHVAHTRSAAAKRRAADEAQMQLFADPSAEIIGALAGVNLDELTPIKALTLLQELKQKLK
jgi:DNA mismatch repair ATPase MutS